MPLIRGTTARCPHRVRALSSTTVPRRITTVLIIRCSSTLLTTVAFILASSSTRPVLSVMPQSEWSSKLTLNSYFKITIKCDPRTVVIDYLLAPSLTHKDTFLLWLNHFLWLSLLSLLKMNLWNNYYFLASVGQTVVKDFFICTKSQLHLISFSFFLYSFLKLASRFHDLHFLLNSHSPDVPKWYFSSAF